MGTLISTVTIVPHVIHTLQTKKPGGSPLAWALGAIGSTVWLAYGIASGDLLVGAPGLVTVPCGLFLAASSARAALAARRVGRVISIVPEPRAPLPLDAAGDLEPVRGLDTLEPAQVPAIA
jgi:hypothetical protein